jgi:hypothetical protein
MHPTLEHVVVELWLVMGWGFVATFLFVGKKIPVPNLAFKRQQHRYISTVHGLRGRPVGSDLFLVIPNILPK